MGEYYGICKRCGFVQLRTYDLPDMPIKFQNGNPWPCRYCKYPLVTMDKEYNKYNLMYRDLNGTRMPDEKTKKAFIEATYMQEHADEVKDIFDPELREKRLAAEEAECAKEEAQKREEQRKKEIASLPVRCPKCHSTSISTQKRGFKVGRGVAVAALTGFVDVGAIAGAVGAGKYINVCQKCGHKWKM